MVWVSPERPEGWQGAPSGGVGEARHHNGGVVMTEIRRAKEKAKGEYLSFGNGDHALRLGPPARVWPGFGWVICLRLSGPATFWEG